MGARDRVLVELSERGETTAALLNVPGLSTRQVSGWLRGLTADGLVRVTNRASARRCLLYELTGKGRGHVNALFQRPPLKKSGGPA